MVSALMLSRGKKDKEAAIFEAACKVIREKGFHQARIDDIARKAGISYGLVYHYYRSKSELFDAISTEWWNGVFAVVDRFEEERGSFREKLAAIVNYFLNQFETRPDMVHIFVTEISRSATNLTPERLDCFRRFFDRTEKLMADAQAGGELRDDIKPRYLTYIFLGALEGFVSAMVFEGQVPSGERRKARIAAGILEVFFNGARPGSAQGPG